MTSSPLRCLLYFAAVFFVFALDYGELNTFKQPSHIFQKYHTGVVTVRTQTRIGTGFTINPKCVSDRMKRRRLTDGFKFIVTAAHVVQDASIAWVRLYQDMKDYDGNWLYDECQIHKIVGVDVVKDVALLAIQCEKCNCTSLQDLQLRSSSVSSGERVLIIGDSRKRRMHSLVEGILSDTNFTSTDTSTVYPHMNLMRAKSAFITRFHGLTGRISYGDSGSAVLDQNGEAIGMMWGFKRDLNQCVTMEEVLTALTGIADSFAPKFIRCTAHEWSLLGRIYWGASSGRSMLEMNALGAAVNAPFIAVALNGDAAHAFTFYHLREEVEDIEDKNQCACEGSSFIDNSVLKRENENAEIMCGCFDFACKKNPLYKKRFGEDNDRRWAIYSRVDWEAANNTQYMSKACQASLEDILDEKNYWRQKFRVVRENKPVKFNWTWLGYGMVAFFLYKKWQHAQNLLREANAVSANLRRQLEIAENANAAYVPIQD